MLDLLGRVTRRVTAAVLVLGLVGAMGIAPLVAGWKMRRPWPGAVLAGPSQGGQGSAGFPAAALELHVELYLGGSWVDITSDVRYVDEGAIGIERSARVHARSAASLSVTMTLNNRDGRYSPRNPTGPYYGQLGQNTPIRIAVRADYRFHGEISALPQKWDKTGNDAWVPLQAHGILWRLNSPSAKPLRSALYRTITKSSLLPVAYWPLEDGVDATSAASGLIGGFPMAVQTGLIDFTDIAPAGSAGGIAPSRTVLGVASGSVPASTATEWQVCFWARATVETSGTQADVWPIRINTTSPNLPFWLLSGLKSPVPPSVAGIATAYDETGSAVDTLVTASMSEPGTMTGDWHLIQVTAKQNGADVDASAYIDGELIDSMTLTSRTVGFPVNVRSLADFFSLGVVINNCADVTVSQVSVYATATPADQHAAGLGHAGETVADRLARLCAEEGITFQLAGTAADTALVGPQQVATLLDLLQQAADADQGMLYEPRDALGIGYRTRVSLYNQPARVSLDYTASDLSEVPEPVGWDRVIENDVTAVRIDGSSARVTVTEGPLSTQDPPDGVGTYDVSFEVNVESDTQLPDVAGWTAHVGTNDDATVDSASVGLHRSAVSEDVYLAANVTAADVGDVIVIDNPPVWLSADQVRLIVTGYRETLATFMRTITWRVTPAGPYDIGVLDSGSLGRLDTAGSELAVAVGESDTTMSLATTQGPLWTTVAGEFPFDLKIGGERVTVTAISGAASPQSATVTRSVNGVVKSHTAGTDVRLWTPLVLAL